MKGERPAQCGSEFSMQRVSTTYFLDADGAEEAEEERLGFGE